MFARGAARRGKVEEVEEEEKEEKEEEEEGNPVRPSNPLPSRTAAESSEVVLPAFMMSRAQCVAAGDSLEPALPNGYPGATPDLLEFEPDKERRRPTWFTPLDCEHCAILHLHYVSCRVVLDTILGPGFMERGTQNGVELHVGPPLDMFRGQRPPHRPYGRCRLSNDDEIVFG